MNLLNIYGGNEYIAPSQCRQATPHFIRRGKLYLLKCICLLFMMLNVITSSAQQVTLSVNKAPLERVFKEITKQSSYVFLYQKNELKGISKISVDIIKADLNETLSAVLSGTSLEYTVINKTIVVRKKQGVPDNGESLLKIQSDSAISLRKEPIQIGTVEVLSQGADHNPSRFVDLTNRSYMNLSQVLQGTIPGLSLQVVNVASKEVTSVEEWTYRNNQGQTIHAFVRYSVDEFLRRTGQERGQQIIDMLLADRNVPENISSNYRINTVSKTTSTLVPQIRGANSFSNGLDAMLVVIDGFPQEGFPADYPMINVESIEVIKDRSELIKWGPRASGGVILIRTKSAKKGKVQITYSSNYYFTKTPRFDRSQLQLASTPQYLDYLQELDTIFRTDFTSNPYNWTPARRLLAQHRTKAISDEYFERSFDSLKMLDNEEQIALLYKDRFNHNQTLGFNGGVEFYKFNLIGNYSSDNTTQINGSERRIAVSLNNNIQLLDKKLQIDWLINYTNGSNRAGYSFSPNNRLEPYQLFLDQQGKYVYDYSNFSPDANRIIESNGYKNHGINILEDARGNRTLSKTVEKKTNFNLRWNLFSGVDFNTSIFYTKSSRTNRNIYDKESSYARQLVNTYGEYTSNGINFYVPYGDIIQSNLSDIEDWNVRSNLSLSRTYGKHDISLSIGGGAASNESKAPPTYTVYGYDSDTKRGGAIFLPTPNPNASITNFNALLPYGSGSASPYTLNVPMRGDTIRSRNINTNANLSYMFNRRLKLSGAYNIVFNPLQGQETTYSSSALYTASASGIILKEIGSWFQDIDLSVGMEGTKLPDLPAMYNNIRYQQNLWNNYAIWVNGLTPTQQKGQSSINYYQKLSFSMLDSSLFINGAYNTRTISGNLGSIGRATNANKEDAETLKENTLRYFSAGIRGQFRRGLLNFSLDYSKSPEGQSQVNGFGNYDISKESFFKSALISELYVGFKIQNISSFQGLGLMMGTNVASNGSFTQSTNSSFSLLPPRNTNYEINFRIGINEDAQTLDLRYYNQSTSGLNNYSPVLTDPSTGLNNRVTYSTINNRGVEFFFNTKVIKRGSFNYNLTLNGAYNQNIAKTVPTTPFTGSSNYATAHREGYDVSNVWSVRSARLSEEGNPQIYDHAGNIISQLDSSSIVSSMVYSGVARAPWTGGLIHEINFGPFFCRGAFTFNLGHVMRTFIPHLSNTDERSAMISERWRQPGDELTKVVPRILNNYNSYRVFATSNGTNSILPADNIRFQELMVGFSTPSSLNKSLGISSCSISLQAQNLAFWARNKEGIDPITIAGDGRIGMPTPRQYSCNISITF